MNTLAKISLIITFLVLIVGCKPEFLVELYTTDILDAMSGDKPILVPATVSVPIQNHKECQKDAQKIVPIFQRYTKTEFIQCKELSGELYDLMDLKVEVAIVSTALSEKTTALFKAVVEERVFNADKFLISGVELDSRVDGLINEIDNEYPFQNADVSELQVTYIINNDQRQPKTIMLQSVFVNNEPYDNPSMLEIDRRGSITVVPSNVRISSLLKNKRAFLFGIKQ